MSKSFSSLEPKIKVLSLFQKKKESDGPTEMDDPEKTTSRVVQLIEQIHANVSSPHEIELTTARLLGMAKARKEARAIIVSHSLAMPLFISILRSGTLMTKVNVAATLGVLCKDEDLRVKVLLGGCIPPLILLLKSDAIEARKAAAESLYKVSSSTFSDEHVGMKIFVTESVVPALWELLSSDNKEDKVLEGFVTGALRNLCGDKDGHWQANIDASGVDIVVRLLSSGNPVTQSNAASLLARLIPVFTDSIPKIVSSGVIKSLLGFLSEKKDVSLRASAADALEAISRKSSEAKQVIVDSGGVPLLIGAIIAPSKESLQGEEAHALQQHSGEALSNICGGMPSLILHLGELAQSPRLAAPVADIIGALAYTLMVFKRSIGEEQFKSTKIESVLILLLKPRDNKVVQDRLLEALASLYGNFHLSKAINQSEAKKVLVGLITMATKDAQESLILALIQMCTEEVSVWEALGKKEGIQLLITSLGLSSKQHQEYAVEMLAILIEQVDDSKWAITAAGGIPPLVHLIRIGSEKAKGVAAHILSNLSSHNKDIRACVESAEPIPALLGLLKDGEANGQEASAKALMVLIKTDDSSTINQLVTLLLGDSPSTKSHVIKVLGHVLSTASHDDIVHKDGTANKGLRSLVQILNSSNAKSQEHAASVLADLFCKRADICDSIATDEVVNQCIKLLTSNNGTATYSNQALSALSHLKNIKTRKAMNFVKDGGIKSLIKLSKASSIDSAENAIATIADLMSNPQIASEALAEDVVSAITRILGEGSFEGKKSASHALHQLLKHFPLSDVLTGSAQCRFAVLGVVDSLNAIGMDTSDAVDALEVIALLCQKKHDKNSSYSPWSALAEVPSSLEPLVHCLCEGPPHLQDKIIEILSRLTAEHPIIVGNSLVSNLRSFAALACRIMKSSSLEVRVGGTALIICAAKEHKLQSTNALEASGYMKPLIYALVEMIKENSTCSSHEIEVSTPRGFSDKSAFRDGDDFDTTDPATIVGSTVALWLLSIISSSHSKNRITLMEAGGLEALSDKLAQHTNENRVKVEDTEGIWIGALLAAILFRDDSLVSSPIITHFIHSLTILLKSNELIDRLFAAHAMASLVCHGNKEINLAIANSDAVVGLTNLIGHTELDSANLIALSEDFSLVRNPDQVVLERLFQIDDVRLGSIARKTIPLFVDLLRPIPDRPGAPPFAVRVLTQIADGNDTNKLLMAEAGVLDALTIYLSLSPQDLTEATISELLSILFSNSDIIRYGAAIRCMEQLIAVLHLGSRSSRLSAARALDKLFVADNVRDSEASIQAIQPLADMLNSTLEDEQQAALSALIKLTSYNNSNAALLAEVEGDPLQILYTILSSDATLELKSDAAELCCALFSDSRVREMPVASKCIEPLVCLMQSNKEIAVESGVCAFERLLDNEKVEIPSTHDFVGMLVGIISGSNYRLIEASICALIKLAKDRTPRKLDMVNAGVIDNCLNVLPTAPGPLCATIVELFRILTNSSAISKSPAAGKIIEPLFTMLLKTDFGLWGQHSALQTLVNILEKPQSLFTLKLTPSEVVEPLIPFLESPSLAIQELGTELLSHLLAQEHFKEDITSKSAVVPFVQLAGIGILNLQQTAIKALENLSLSWPKEVIDAGGIFEISKVITQDDPLPPAELWETAALIISNLLRYDTDCCFKVPIMALVKLLRSTVEDTIVVALNALIVQEAGASSAELMAEAGAIDALLDLLRSHRFEEESGRLLEALFRNMRVRDMKASKYAIAPLAQYLLDPQTKSQNNKLLAALALGDLSQHEGLSRASDSVSACRALLIQLENQPSEEMEMVALCALQNFVMRSRTNRKTIAEAGGVQMIQELLTSSNPEVAVQAALLIKNLFSNHTLQEYVSSDLVRSLAAALEKDLCSTSTVNEEVLKTIYVILSNFHKLHISEATTLCISQLVAALKSGNEAAQDLVLTTLCLLKQSWLAMPVDVSRSQAKAAAEAIPLLQMFMKTKPPKFHEREESLLICLPGCLTVTIKCGNNLKPATGGTNAYCRLSIGNGPPRRTKVVNHNISPKWNESFTWAFDVPPKGQQLFIVCRNKSTFGKTTLGRATIQIDRVVIEGIHSGVFNLTHDTIKDGSSRTIEIDIAWSNMSNESV